MPRTPVTPLSFWTDGINSLLPPDEIAKAQYAWGENIINRGGIIQTRPGRRPVASIRGKKAQGFTIFAPTGSTAKLIAAVDGSIYVMSYPGFTPMKLDGIQMDSGVDKVHFCSALKSVKRNADNSLKLIEPTKVLMISDGVTNTAFWDGTTARHLDPSAPALETPVCTWMAWIASRLWMAFGPKIYASDLNDPLSHFEATYLSYPDAFYLDDDCTGLVVTPHQAGLLAFTRETTTSFQASIRTRTSWGNTLSFQDEFLQKIGCVAGRTAFNQYGFTYWLSNKGFVSLNSSVQTLRDSKLQTLDDVMMRSRRQLGPNTSGACGTSFENLLLLSVPSGTRYNNHTWVMDQTPLGSQASKAGAWASNWTGTRPVEWATGTVGGRDRIYNLSFDYSSMDDTQIHVWEEMLSARTDASGPIKCQFITGAIGSDSLARFKFATFDAVELLGDVNLKTYVGGKRGPWYPIGNFNLQAEEGCFGSSLMPIIQKDTIFESYAPQSRPLRTEEFRGEGKVQTAEMKPYGPGVDRSFQLCFEWTGRMGIRELMTTIAEGPAEVHGNPGAVKADGTGGEKGQVNAITETGDPPTEQLT